VLAYVAGAYVEQGDRTRAEEILSQLRDQHRSGLAVWLSIAMVFDALGRVDEAVDALERSVAEHEPFVWGLSLEGWLRFPNARRSPRFVALLARLGATPHDIARQRRLLREHAMGDQVEPQWLR
jgi:thioredoxin-like negative regulator of GroEL